MIQLLEPPKNQFCINQNIELGGFVKTVPRRLVAWSESVGNKLRSIQAGHLPPWLSLPDLHEWNHVSVYDPEVDCKWCIINENATPAAVSEFEVELEV